MALKIRLTDAEHKKLSAHQLSYYVREGDGWRLDVESSEEADKAELLAVRAELKELRRAAHERAELFGTPDLDVQRQRLAEALEVAENGMTDAQFAEVTAQHEAAFAERCAEIESEHNERVAPILAELRTQRAGRTIVAAMVRGGVRPDSMHLLRPHIEQSIRVEGDHAHPTITVLDESGNPRIAADGNAVSIDQLLLEWRLLDPALSVCFTPTGNDRNGNGPH